MSKESFDEGPLGEHVDEYIGQKLREYEVLISNINGQEISLESLQTLLQEANGWINLWCGPQREVFDQFRYHLIATEEGSFRVIQGWELDTEPGHDDKP